VDESGLQVAALIQLGGRRDAPLSTARYFR
jgi:hypothetical protein